MVVRVKRGELLGNPESLCGYNVAGNGRRDSLKTTKDWAISSQASVIRRRFRDYDITLNLKAICWKEI